LKGKGGKTRTPTLGPNSSQREAVPKRNEKTGGLTAVLLLAGAGADPEQAKDERPWPTEVGGVIEKKNKK